MAALSKADTDMLHRVNDIFLERPNQQGGMTVGITGIILGFDDTDPMPNHLKCRSIKVSAQQPVVDGVRITLVFSTGTLSIEEIMIAMLAGTAAFWGEGWLGLLEHKDWRKENIALAVFVGMLSPWSTEHVPKAFFEAFKGDPKNLEKYLPVLVLGYLKQQTVVNELEECPEIEKALEDLEVFVAKFCDPNVQERYAQLRPKSTKRAKHA